MTDVDLDAALDSSAPVLDEVAIKAVWQELPPGYDAAAVTNLDSVADLGQQIGPAGYKVEQSLIDGLPDALTMTSTNEGYGTLEADLIGRGANRADTWGHRTPGSGTGTGVSVTIPYPSGTAFNDYVTIGIAVNSTVDVTDADADETDRHGWVLLGTATDGTLKTWVWGAKWYTGRPSLTLSLSASASYSWVSTASWAQTAAGTWVDVLPYLPGIVKLEETVTRTAHPLPSQDLPGRGWGLGFFATTAASAQWSATGTDTEVIEAAAVTDLALMRTATQPGPNPTLAMTANTTGSTGVAAAVGIPLYIADRPDLTAPNYFSPFREDSPVYGFDRDTADLTATVNVVTAVGTVGTQVFSGQMKDIPVNASQGTAELKGVSRTRVLLDRSRTPPLMYGHREGGSIDWLANWLMANGGQTVGPGPSSKTRIWVPMYGSLRPYTAAMNDYSSGYLYDMNPAGVAQGYRRPVSVPGPYVSGMFASYADTEVLQIWCNFDRLPGKAAVPGIDLPEHNDWMSQLNSVGRMTVWLRGDVAFAGTPDAFGALTGLDHLFKFNMSAQTNVRTNGTNRGSIGVRIDATTRRVAIKMGDYTGVQEVLLTGSELPADGEWHFLGVVWDWAAGTMIARLDGTSWTQGGYTTDPTLLVGSEAELEAAGGYVFRDYTSNIPVSDLQVEVGPGLYTEQFTRFWPKPDPAAIYRRTDQWLEVLAEAQPLAGWDTLHELGQATMSAIRCDEQDRFCFMPPSYFGETEQATVEMVADTERNASALNVLNDPSKSRNALTIEYPETTVDTKHSSVFELKSATAVPPGITFYAFSLDVPTAELYGASAPFSGTTWDLLRLSGNQISGISTISPNMHVMSMNAKEDGSGTIAPLTSVTARVIGLADAYTAIVCFKNVTAQTWWLSNNGEDKPFLRLVGYPIRVREAYVTVRDESQVRIRQERNVSHSNKWLQKRADATTIAGTIVSTVSLPRAEVWVTVMGDPRRKPGQLVQLADSEGTQAAGTWRVLTVRHNGNGPEFTQDLQLVRVGDVALWDGLPGWDLGTWGE
jgi:hypothetical protein